jgi:predicted dehydrogenase
MSELSHPPMNACVGSGTAPSSIRHRRSVPRLAFLGLGWIGRHRLSALVNSGMVEVCGIADPADAARDAAAGLVPAAVSARTLEELLELGPDGVVIATPSALHAEQAIAALEAGCAVFCQKPLARTAAETAAVLAAARRANRLLGVDFSYRHTAGMRAIHRLIREGVLGQIYAVEMRFHNAYGPDKPWFYDASLSGGGCLIDLGTHLVDLALWCLDFPGILRARSSLLRSGIPVRGSAQELRPQRPGEVEDYAAAQLDLANGVVVQLTCSWGAPAGCDAEMEATFFGTGGAGRFRNVAGSFYDFTAEHFLPDRSRSMLCAPPDDWGGRAALRWAGQLADAAGYDVEIEPVIHVAATLDTLYQGGS